MRQETQHQFLYFLSVLLVIGGQCHRHAGRCCRFVSRTKPTKFETDKAKLRRTIRQALSQAASFDEFASLLLREGVTVKESRGRLSYLTPDRTKPITAQMCIRDRI